MASETEADEEVSKPLPGGSFEACVRRFEDDPEVDDPEALCGWLESNQSNEVVSAWDPEEDSIEDLLDALADPEAEKVLQNLKVTYVSGVESPAQDSHWVMAKDADDRGADWGVTAPLVFKQEEPPMPEEGEESDGEDERKAWAPVLIPNETDKQGDVVPIGEIEAAAHGFLANYRKIDTDHDLMEGKGVPIESWTLKQDTTFSLPNGDGETREYPVGTWLMGVQFNDEAWDRVKAGELQGFSIYGEAENTPIEEVLGLATEKVDRTAGAHVELAKEVRQIAKETNTTMSNEETEDGEGGEETEAALESIKSTVEDNNTLAKETREDLNDLQKSHESLEDRVDELEEDLEAVKSGEGEEDEEDEEDEETDDGEGGEETEAGKDEDGPEDAVTEEDLEEAKEALREEMDGETEEAAEKAAEAAVKSVLGLDEDEDLPEDAEERRDVIRKGLTEPGEDGGTGGSIGFTAEDVSNAVRGGN